MTYFKIFIILQGHKYWNSDNKEQGTVTLNTVKDLQCRNVITKPLQCVMKCTCHLNKVYGLHFFTSGFSVGSWTLSKDVKAVADHITFMENSLTAYAERAHIIYLLSAYAVMSSHVDNQWTDHHANTYCIISLATNGSCSAFLHLLYSGTTFVLSSSHLPQL